MAVELAGGQIFVGKELQQPPHLLFKDGFVTPQIGASSEALGYRFFGAWRVGVEDHLCSAAHGEDLLQMVLPACTQWKPRVAVAFKAITLVGTGKGRPGCRGPLLSRLADCQAAGGREP